MKPFILSLASFTLCAPSTYAATYIEPNLEGVTLVKVDQVPIDTNTMRWMAGYLAEIAQQQAGSTDAKKLQASAKLIAIARQLDSSLPQTTSANLKLQQGLVSKSNDKHAENHRKRLRAILEYLAGEESNAEAKLLSQLTKDALAPIVPENSALANFSAPKQLWQNCIAHQDKFASIDTPKLVSNNRVEHREVTPASPPKVEPTPAPQKPNLPEGIAKAQWKTTELNLLVPFTSYEVVGEHNKSVYSTGLKEVIVSISPLPVKENQKSTFYSTPTLLNQDHIAHFVHSSFKPLQSTWRDIPAAKFSFKFANAYSNHSDHDLTNSALTVAFDSALHGTPLRPNLLVISTIDHTGKFTRTKKFWSTLDLLMKEARDQRIFVGEGSEEYLLQVLALGSPEFFIQNEIIQIENLLESRKLSSTDDHEDYVEATALFAEVKSAIEQKSIRSMTANKYVRDKLEKVVSIMPNHLSAKILLEYGTRKNDSILESKFFAIEMKSLLHKIDSHFRNKESKLSDHHAMAQSELIAKRLKIIEPIISKEDLIICEKVEKIGSELRTFSKATKNANDKNNTYYQNTAKRKLREIKTLNNEVQIDLARLSGTPPKEE